MELRRTFQMIDAGEIKDAEPRLSESLADYERRQAPPEEMAVLYKYRADVRVNLGKLELAHKDYSAALAAVQAADPISDTMSLAPLS